MRKSPLFTQDQRDSLAKAAILGVVGWSIMTPLWIVALLAADVNALVYVIMGVISGIGFGWSLLLLILFRR